MSHRNALTISGRGGILRVLQSEVGVSLPFIGDPKDQKIASLNYKGVWDTGATGTVITKKVVSDLDLKPTGQTDVYTAKGKATTNTYLVDIYLPMGVVINGVKVTEGDLPPNTELLIGMDIITLGDFVITHDKGVTKMSFGMPSVNSYDYVEKLKSKNEIEEKKQKCHCGSGKKFRFCHGLNR